MSYGGHVYDMVQRFKQNRELLNHSIKNKKKEKKNNLPTYITGKSSTAEELERINQNREERELNERRYLLSIQTIFASILLIALLLILGIMFLIK